VPYVAVMCLGHSLSVVFRRIKFELLLVLKLFATFMYLHFFIFVFFRKLSRNEIRFNLDSFIRQVV